MTTSTIPAHSAPARWDNQKHWVARHRALAIVVASMLFVLYSLALVEFGHWMAEGFPPLIPHLQEAFEHMSGMTANWMWW